MKLLICVPTSDYIHFRFVDCLQKLIRRLDADNVKYDVCILGCTLVYIARDKLAHKAISGGYTHTLWLDSDMTFNDDLLEDLLFSRRKMVTGLCFARRPPHIPCIFEEIWPECKVFEDYPKSEVFRIAACGMACVLIETEVLQAVKEKFGTCFFPMRELGEDLAFCKRVTECGYKIYADASIRPGHIGHFEVKEETREAWKKSIGYDEVNHVRES